MFPVINQLECNKVLLNYTKLQNQKNNHLISYETNPLKTVIGFMGEYHNLLIRFRSSETDDEEKETIKNVNLFLKRIPNNKFDKKEIESNGMFKKEIGIYESILGQLKLYCPMKIFPECYFTGKDLLVMENLSHNGYSNVKKENYTLNHYYVVLDNIATLHTASILYEYKTKNNIGDFFYQYLQETQINPSNKWYNTGLLGIKTVALMHPKFQNIEKKKFIQDNVLRILSEACNLVKRSKKYRNVFCHRDLWDSNILFKCNHNNNPINCAFVDFQLSRYTPPAFDVLFFIYLNSTWNLRKQIIDNCLKYYYNSLVKQISKYDIPNSDQIVPWDEFLESCETIKLVILVLRAICVPMCNIPNGWTENIKVSNPEKFDYYMTCRRDEMLIELMGKYDYYRNVVFESVEELIDYILDKKFDNVL